MKRLLPGLTAFTAAMLVALLGLYAEAGTPEPRKGKAPPPPVVKLRLLGVNDFHGHLEPPRPGIGGAAWLKSHLDRATLPGHTIRVHAGDMVGATPLISSLFHDEPAIEAANEIGFDVGTVGNHEFDEGGDELMRLLQGGQRTGPEALKPDVTGRLVNTSSPDFGGTDFPYIAANTVDRDGELLLPPYEIVERAGARVGFIGVTTRSTPTFLLERHAARFRFTDISEAVDRWVPELRRRGVEAIVVLAHAGGPGQDQSDAPDFVGEIVDEARQMSSAVDVVVAGHSHSRIQVRLPNSDGSGDKLIVEALSYGVAYDLVDIRVDTRTGEVVSKTGEIPDTRHEGVEGDAGVAALVERYRERVAPLADHVVGVADAPLTRSGGELGQLVANAERAYAGTDVAVVKPVSLRADIEAGPVTYAEVAEALAFDHPVLRLTMSGRRLRELIGADAYVAGPEQLNSDASYSVAASELIAGGGRAVGTEPQALAWFLAPGGRLRSDPDRL
ncbi:MAG TPA: bifunctional metallophosphatase/5'-nucleotidase [Thermoleophilaceae bacterium]|nr:bifunctional metallophosphatase/5'-nucleotidase [Thermoleophilaceae bacterium]